MSCFICEDETFKSVSKLAFVYGLRQETRTNYPLTLKELNLFTKLVAEINCSNYCKLYKVSFKESIPDSVEKFSELPSLKITAQDIRSTQCWMYQVSDYYEQDEIYKLVEKAYNWALENLNISKEDIENAQWR